jgi:UDP-galactopyranose mutase
VGAGFAGGVLAERLARERNETVLLIDKRRHLGGNAYDRFDAAGILIHEYGPHIFHTNSAAVVDYLSKFTAWRPYEHRVLASIAGRLYPIPINRSTVNLFFSLNLRSENEAADYLARIAEPVPQIRTAEDAVVAKVGRKLYEAFFRYYTEKQWGIHPSRLDATVTARIPVRTNTDDRYFTDRFQAMPREGYTRLFSRMLDHPNIEIQLGTEFRSIRRKVHYRRLIFTGPVDEFFDFQFGRLPYRSVQVLHRTFDDRLRQPVAVINFTQSETYTRVAEYKHITGQQHEKTSVSFEYPLQEGEPCYPIPSPESALLYRRYAELARENRDVFFVGRLASYQYLNMDQVVGQALATFRRIRDSETIDATSELPKPDLRN